MPREKNNSLPRANYLGNRKIPKKYWKMTKETKEFYIFERLPEQRTIEAIE